MFGSKVRSWAPPRLPSKCRSATVNNARCSGPKGHPAAGEIRTGSGKRKRCILGSDLVLPSQLLSADILPSLHHRKRPHIGGSATGGHGQPIQLPLPVPLDRRHLDSGLVLVVYLAMHVQASEETHSNARRSDSRPSGTSGPGTKWSTDMGTIVPVLAFSHQTGVTLAEVGFLLILFAGVWLVAAQIPAFKMSTARTIVAGIALACAGVLLIIATHWGHFG